MKLYLSSYGIGAKSELLSQMIVGGRNIGVIRNALDFSQDTSRLAQGMKREFDWLSAIGLSPIEVDLKKYFDSKDKLDTLLCRLDALWVVGGNAFLLNYAFQRSGLSTILQSTLSRKEFVYAGYSAGVCVLAPTLNGIHLVDDPNAKAAGYPCKLPSRSLGLLPFSIAPHWKSDHPESAAIERVVDYFIENKMPFIALRDGEVYVTALEGESAREKEVLNFGDEQV